MADVGAADLTRVFRDESGRAVATLVRLFGDIDMAEEAVQEAFLTAARTWPTAGTPSNPGGWITTTARNHAIDRLRREAPRARACAARRPAAPRRPGCRGAAGP